MARITRTSDIKKALSAVSEAFRAMRSHTERQEVSSWDELGRIIGYKSVRNIRVLDSVDTARTVLAVLLEQGHTVSTDGRRVYTDAPMSADMLQGWRALQPALLRAIK